MVNLLGMDVQFLCFGRFVIETVREDFRGSRKKLSDLFK